MILKRCLQSDEQVDEDLFKKQTNYETIGRILNFEVKRASFEKIELKAMTKVVKANQNQEN